MAVYAVSDNSWRGEDGLLHVAELLTTLPSATPATGRWKLGALCCAFAGVKRYQTRVQRAAGWAARARH